MSPGHNPRGNAFSRRLLTFIERDVDHSLFIRKYHTEHPRRGTKAIDPSIEYVEPA